MQKLKQRRVPIRIKRKRRADRIGIALIVASLIGISACAGAGIYHDFYQSESHHFVKG